MVVCERIGVFVALVSSLLMQHTAIAQIKITYPFTRQVVQRDNNNQATIQIAGSYAQPLDVVEARVVPRVAGQGTATNWATLQTAPANGQFNGTLTVKGGWYTIYVRGRSGNTVVATDSLDRFGVGEVFAILGHSNAQGSGCTVNGTNMCPTIDGASDERVVVVPVDQSTPDFQQYLNTAQTGYLPGMNFSQLLTFSGISPFGGFAWLWGHMGDVLVQRINVPVLFYNAGFGGTNMQQTYWAAYDIPFQHSFVRYDLRMPYANVRNLMNLYVPNTGLRAVLIQHGENDRGNPTDSTSKYYYKVIDKIRAEFNKPNLGMIVAISSFVGARFDNVRAAQFQVINTPGEGAYLGPDLDNIYTPSDRPDGIHFSPTGQVKAGELWANAITDSYLSTLNPYPGLVQPLASVACTPGNQLQLTQPAGYQYSWTTGSTVSSLTVGAGQYGARLVDAQNRVFFPPPVVVPATVQPPTPTIATDNGTAIICRTAGLTLRSSYPGLNTWSTGASSTSVVVTTPGVYTVQAKNPVYGCVSGITSQTISLSSANLGITLQTNRRVVAVNDTVGFTLTVNNRGTCDAGPLTVQSRLPSNVAFVSSGSSLSAANAVVSGTIPAVAAGASVSRRYVARLSAAGMYLTAAELTASTNPLTNATLNNGTANGEEDEALADVRTTTPAATTAGSAIFVSPNPNQGPYPTVQSNQPAADPARADLSIQLQLSTQVFTVGQVLSMTVTVQNRGGLAATNVTVKDSLSPQLQFTIFRNGVVLVGSTTTGTISQIPAGESRSLVFSLQATARGNYRAFTQVLKADQTDPDSVPGNGFTNGEDDQASTSLRSP